MGNHRKLETGKKPRAVIGTPWWVRQLIYVIVAVAGLIMTAIGIVEPDTVDQWLAQAGPVAAAIGGIVAALHTGRESDEKPVGVPMDRVMPEPEPEPASAGFSLYQR